MKPFSTYLQEDFITEAYVNLFIADKVERQKYVDDVWDMLQAAYAEINGIHGSGFESKEDMINKIPFWKLAIRNGKVVAVKMYKDKDGRKMVAGGTDRSQAGKDAMLDIMVNDLKRERGYGEVSSAMLSFLVKNVGYDFIVKYAKTPEEAAKILKDDELFPVNDPKDRDWEKHAPLRKFFYRRDIGGSLHTKMMLGTTGKTIS